MTQGPDFDWIIVGSGFGGSVSALRLAEKGYRVLVLEKGRRWSPHDFPRTNLELRRWLWAPGLGLRGFFQMSFLEHVTVLHGVGVGGGSLAYANTLPLPSEDFFRAPSWGRLADWARELAPHYAAASRMLGAADNPEPTRGDRVLGAVAAEVGLAEGALRPARVGVFFGEPGRRVPDPFFGGEGPDRVGCTFCGACMSGCRVGAKNTLDRNYLHLAEGRGVELRSEAEVTAVRALPGGGFRVEIRGNGRSAGRREALTAERVVLAGGVMGTVPLLLRMREDPHGLPRLSPRVGDGVRTNSEALVGVIAPEVGDFHRGVAISSVLRTAEGSTLEPVRFGAGSGFFRFLALPHAPGRSLPQRLAGALGALLRSPHRWVRALTVGDFARHSQVLLYMRTHEGTLSLRLGRSRWTGFRRGLVSALDDPASAPRAFFPEATELAERFADRVGGVTAGLLTETLRGVPTTAHILGGAVMGTHPGEGVIDAGHRVFGYEGLFVVDGSAVSANPGVNPALTIAALAERAMTGVEPRER